MQFFYGQIIRQFVTGALIAQSETESRIELKFSEFVSISLKKDADDVTKYAARNVKCLQMEFL